MGHTFKPSDHLNSKHILEKIHQKTNLAIIGLKKVEMQGRYLLTNTFLSSQLNYHITQINRIFRKDTDSMQKLINNFIKAPYSNYSKYKPFNKGGAQVPNVFNIIQAGKIASFKSYLHSKFKYKVYLRQLFKELGFELKNVLNIGEKLQNMTINLLDQLGMTRFAIIMKTTFSIIDQSRPNHIPILGNLEDRNLPRFPEALSSLKLRENKFTMKMKYICHYQE